MPLAGAYCPAMSGDGGRVDGDSYSSNSNDGVDFLVAAIILAMSMVMLSLKLNIRVQRQMYYCDMHACIQYV